MVFKIILFVVITFIQWFRHYQGPYQAVLNTEDIVVNKTEVVYVHFKLTF